MEIVMEIRDAICSDTDSIYKVGKKNLPIYYDKQDIRLQIIDRDYTVKVALIDRMIVGYCIAKLMNKARLHIMSFAVDEKFRRRGVGRDLLKDIEKDAAVRDCRILSLYVMKSNTGAINFYEDFGFIMRSIMENYYGKDNDGLVFYKCVKKTTES